MTDFDFARPGAPRDRTIAQELPEAVDPAYLAPELKENPANSSSASDVYAAGATIYELFTGAKAFETLDGALGATRALPEPPSSLTTGLPNGFDDWLESLCSLGDKERPTAAQALVGFDALFAPAEPPLSETSSAHNATLDYANLQPGTLLKNKYQVEGPPLGHGGFGRVWWKSSIHLET